MAAFLRLSLPAATGVLAAATVAGIAGLYRLGLHAYALLVLVPVFAVALVYLRAYSARPLRTQAVRPPPPAPSPGAAPSEPPAAPEASADASSPPEPAGVVESPFDADPSYDPVEEADAIDSAGAANPPPPG